MFLVVFPLVPLHWPAFLLSFEVSFSSSWRPEISWIFTRYLVTFGWYCLLVLLHFFRRTIFFFNFFPSLHQPFASGFSLLLSFCMLDHLIAIFRMFGTSNCYSRSRWKPVQKLIFLILFSSPCVFSVTWGCPCLGQGRFSFPVLSCRFSWIHFKILFSVLFWMLGGRIHHLASPWICGGSCQSSVSALEQLYKGLWSLRFWTLEQYSLSAPLMDRFQGLPWRLLRMILIRIQGFSAEGNCP